MSLYKRFYVKQILYLRGYFMARKTQISKEVILENAFQMLLREGYSAINIIALSKEIGCSTQPIAWHFGNMDGLRAELLTYCLDFLKDFFETRGDDAVSILEEIAEKYINLAIDYPQLYKYIYISEHDGEKMGQIAHSLRAKNQDKILQMLQMEQGISAEQAGSYMMNLQIYVHGIASFAVTKFTFPSKEVVMHMIHEANQAFLKQIKG